MKLIFMASGVHSGYSFAVTDPFAAPLLMRQFLHTEVQALIVRAGLNQAGFARLTGYTVQQVNAWCRGRSPLPRWAGLLLVALQEIPGDALEALTENQEFTWHEVLGVPDNADPTQLRRARAGLAALHHPDKGGDTNQMQRINAAYDQGSRWL
jgi:hypothetical protein